MKLTDDGAFVGHLPDARVDLLACVEALILGCAALASGSAGALPWRFSLLHLLVGVYSSFDIPSTVYARADFKRMAATWTAAEPSRSMKAIPSSATPVTAMKSSSA